MFSRVQDVFSGQIFYFLILGLKSVGFHFQKYKKSLLLRKYKKFFNLRVRKLHSPKCKKLFSGKFFFKLFKLRLKCGLCSPIFTTMGIYGLELLVVYHHPNESCDHKFCDSRDIIFLICHMTCREQMFKGIYEFIGGSPSH